MEYAVKLLPEAFTDLKEAVAWYQEKNSDLVASFREEVQKEIDYIALHPTNYQCKYKELRQSLVHQFPYAIFYLVDEQLQQIVIFGVLHTKRNPKTIRKRSSK